MIKDLLAKEGIECLLRNDSLSMALGEVPFVECYPELWVIDDECYPRAKLLLDAWLKESSVTVEGSWTCPACKEQSDGHFGACWSCGRLHE